MSDPKPPTDRRSTALPTWKSELGFAVSVEDSVVTEEPLEIRLAAGGEVKTAAVTMRTPGADEELALGFLLAEGVITGRHEVEALETLSDPWGEPGAPSNVVVVHLKRPQLPPLAGLDRHFFSSSACGVCGRAGIANLLAQLERGSQPQAPVEPCLTVETLLSLPEKLREVQGVFATTGGLHAAALFSFSGELAVVREDVGRHNAVDKVIGWGLGQDAQAFGRQVLMVSGRAGFEVLQKAAVVGLPIVASVSAPSSLAVELARVRGLTLVGFLRSGRFNVYACPERIVER